MTAAGFRRSAINDCKGNVTTASIMLKRPTRGERRNALQAAPASRARPVRHVPRDQPGHNSPPNDLVYSPSLAASVTPADELRFRRRDRY